MAIKLKSAPTPALEVNTMKPGDLVPYGNNPRRNDAQVPKMVELIKTFGFKVPILVRGNRVVDGHLRLKAAIAMGLDAVPVIDLGDMPETAEKALRIALNKSVEWAEWDNELLGKEMQSIMAGGMSLDLTGFSSKEVDKLIKQVAETPIVIPGSKITKTKDANAGAPADPNYVSIVFHMTADNRDIVLAVLNAYRAKHGHVNVSAALVALLSDSAEGNAA